MTRVAQPRPSTEQTHVDPALIGSKPAATPSSRAPKSSADRELNQLRSMMENAPTNMMFADANFTITYMNPASLNTLRGLSQYLPVPVDQIIGSSLDIFHKNPSYQRGIMAGGQGLPRRANIQVGPETLDLLVSPIRDAEGTYLGAMATWQVITEKIQLEKTAAEVAADAKAVSQVLAVLADATSAEAAAQRVVDVVRQAFGWDYGSYWKLDAASNTLGFAVESGTVSSEFHQITTTATFAEGVGLSGRAWRARDLVFTADLGEMKDCVRAPAAQRAGVKSGVCFPIVMGGQVVGTMDFFSLETLEPSQGRLDALRSVGRLVGQALDRIAEQERQARDAQDLRRKVDTILAVVASAAAGDLTQSVAVSGTDAVGQLGESLEGFFASLRSTMSDLAGLAQSLSAAAEELSVVSQQLGENAGATLERAESTSSASTEVTANVEIVAAAAEEMTASIQEISKNTADAAQIAVNAVLVANSATATVASLGESSSQIGQVVKLITSIAQQTNLLALNATIEAARAGEAGKGFAVVANEVKELAKATAKATEDIGQRIETIQEDTRGAVRSIDEISTIIADISNAQTAVAGAVEEQSATTNEIARNISEAALGANDIAQSVVVVAEAAHSTSTGANDTRRAAEELSVMASDLQAKLSQFRF